jgi:hypothetical protein
VRKDKYIGKIYKQVYPRDDDTHHKDKQDVIVFRVDEMVNKEKHQYKNTVLYSKWEVLERGTDCYRCRDELKTLEEITEEEALAYVI